MEILLLIFAFFIVAGKLFDQLTFESEKSVIRDRLNNYLLSVEKLQFPQLHQLVILNFLNFIKTTVFSRRSIFISIGKVILISWTFTTILRHLGNILADYDYKSNIIAWHDYFPWYSTYLINLVFDFLTVLITYLLLNWIKFKGSLMSIIVISIDILIAYVLFVTCLAYLYIGESSSSSFQLGQSYIDKYGEVDDFFIRKDTFRLKNNQHPYSIELSNSILQIIKKDGFTEEALVMDSGNTSLLKKRNKELFKLFNPKNLYKAIFLEKGFSIKSKDLAITVTEGAKHKIYNFSFTVPITLGTVFIAASSFIPSLILLSFLLMTYISKELFYFYKWFANRFIKTTVKDDNSLDKFNPGTHAGTVLGLFAALIKLLFELFK